MQVHATNKNLIAGDKNVESACKGGRAERKYEQQISQKDVELPWTWHRPTWCRRMKNGRATLLWSQTLRNTELTGRKAK